MYLSAGVGGAVLDESTHDVLGVLDGGSCVGFKEAAGRSVESVEATGRSERTSEGFLESKGAAEGVVPKRHTIG